MKNINILICSCGKRVDLINCFKSALRKSGKVIITDANDLNAGKYFADRFFKSPRVGSKSYLPFMKKIIKQNRIRLILSVIDPELLLLAKYKEIFAELGAKTLISSLKSLEIANDKRKTAEFFKKIGIFSPEIFEFEQVKKFPVFIKPYDGSASKFVYKADNKRELEVFYKMVPNPIILQFIDGQEYTIDCLCDFEGRVLNIIPRKRLEVVGGISIKSIVDLDQGIISDTKKILESIDTIGPITVQMIKSRDGNYFTELNLRFGGGAMLGIASGGNFVSKIIEMFNGRKFDFANNEVRNGYTMVAYLAHKFGYEKEN